jgi:ABC-type multidrug transport system permease subunit
MDPKATLSARRSVLIGVGLIAGLGIAAVDAFGSSGEVSPIVVVVMLLSATAVIGFILPWRGWTAAVATWLPIPLAHLLKLLLGLPDTLHPNTYASAFKLAAFTLLVSAIGMSCGSVVRSVDTRARGPQRK